MAANTNTDDGLEVSQPTDTDRIALSRKRAMTLREWILDDPAMDHAEEGDPIMDAQEELIAAIDAAFERIEEQYGGEEEFRTEPLTGDVVADMPEWVDDGMIVSNVEKDGEIWRETYEFTISKKVADYSDE